MFCHTACCLAIVFFLVRFCEFFREFWSVFRNYSQEIVFQKLQQLTGLCTDYLASGWYGIISVSNLFSMFVLKICIWKGSALFFNCVYGKQSEFCMHCGSFLVPNPVVVKILNSFLNQLICLMNQCQLYLFKLVIICIHNNNLLRCYHLNLLSLDKF